MFQAPPCWTPADEMQLAALTRKREEAVRSNRQSLSKIIEPALGRVIPHLDAGGTPGWPGIHRIADEVAVALIQAGVTPLDKRVVPASGLGFPAARHA